MDKVKFDTVKKLNKWIVWLHSEKHGWGERLIGILQW